MKKKTLISKYYKVWGEDDSWLDIGALRFHVYNGNFLRIAYLKITDETESLIRLKQAIEESKTLLEIMFDSEIVSITDNGFFSGGASIDICFKERL